METDGVFAMFAPVCAIDCRKEKGEPDSRRERSAAQRRERVSGKHSHWPPYGYPAGR
jgi:hypothetical protein